MKKFILFTTLLFAVGFANYTLAAPLPPQLCFSTTGLSLSIDWTPVSDATDYTLYYAPFPYTGPDSIRRVDRGNERDFSYYLWNGATFYIAATASNAMGESSYSNIELFAATSSTVTSSLTDCSETSAGVARSSIIGRWDLNLDNTYWDTANNELVEYNGSYVELTNSTFKHVLVRNDVVVENVTVNYNITNNIIILDGRGEATIALSNDGTILTIAYSDGDIETFEKNNQGRVTINVADYSGLSATNRWDYKWTEDGQVNNWSVVNGGISSRNAKSVYMLKEYNENNSPSDQEFILSNLSTGIFMAGGLSDQGNPFEEFSFTPEMPFLLASFVPGETYEYDHIESRMGDGTWSLTVIPEAVTVPAGTYSDCYKSTVVRSYDAGTAIDIRWYAKNVGLVKRYENNPDGVSTWELTEVVPLSPTIRILDYYGYVPGEIRVYQGTWDSNEIRVEIVQQPQNMTIDGVQRYVYPIQNLAYGNNSLDYVYTAYEYSDGESWVLWKEVDSNNEEIFSFPLFPIFAQTGQSYNGVDVIEKGVKVFSRLGDDQLEYVKTRVQNPGGAGSWMIYYVDNHGEYVLPLNQTVESNPQKYLLYRQYSTVTIGQKPDWFDSEMGNYSN